MIDADDLIALVQNYNPKTNAKLIARAYEYGQKMHRGQMRHSGEPYFSHPVAVAAILTEQMLDDATIVTNTYAGTVRIAPEARMQEVVRSQIPKKYERVKGGHFQEWIDACKGGPICGSNFEYSGPFTETVLLGNLAIRTRRRLEWDPAKLQVTNVPEANRFIKRDYRPGWDI